MDKSLKVTAQKTAAEFGLPLGTMINVLLRQVVRRQELYLCSAKSPPPYYRQMLDELRKELLKETRK